MKKWIALLLVLCIGAGGGWYWLKSGKKGKIRILETSVVENGTVRKVLEATGIVQAQVGAMISIGARATGTLKNVSAKVGDKVVKGQLVAEIDDRELQAKIAEAVAQLRLAQAKYEYAAKTLPRKQSLVKKKLESQDTLDQALQSANVAKYEVDAAKARLHTLRVQESYYKIFSPIDGVVSQVAAQEGETIVSGLNVSNLVTILAPEKLEMWIYVDETDVGRVSVGLPVEFRVDAYFDRMFTGTVDRVYPEPEVRDNIVYYKALVKLTPEDANFLRPQMTTQCKIIVKTLKDVLSVPNNALKWVAGKQVVYVDMGKDVPPREVTPELGLQGLERSQILSGLNAGEKVATQLVLPGIKLGEKGI